jgi:hypothetical protein
VKFRARTGRPNSTRTQSITAPSTQNSKSPKGQTKSKPLTPTREPTNSSEPNRVADAAASRANQRSKSSHSGEQPHLAPRAPPNPKPQKCSRRTRPPGPKSADGSGTRIERRDGEGEGVAGRALTVAAARIRLLISRLASISRNFFPPARSPAPEAARVNSKDGKEEWGRPCIYTSGSGLASSWAGPMRLPSNGPPYLFLVAEKYCLLLASMSQYS